MKRDLSKFRRRLGLKLIGAAFILLGFAGMLQLMIRPNIINVCEYNSRAVTVSLIDDAINERLTELGEDVGYSALVKLSFFHRKRHKADKPHKERYADRDKRQADERRNRKR